MTRRRKRMNRKRRNQSASKSPTQEGPVATPNPDASSLPTFYLSNSINIGVVGPYVESLLSCTSTNYEPEPNTYFNTFQTGSNLTEYQKLPRVLFPEPGKNLTQFMTALRVRHSLRSDEVVNVIRVVFPTSSITLDVNYEQAELDWEKILVAMKYREVIPDLLFSTVMAFDAQIENLRVRYDRCRKALEAQLQELRLG